MSKKENGATQEGATPVAEQHPRIDSDAQAMMMQSLHAMSGIAQCDASCPPPPSGFAKYSMAIQSMAQSVNSKEETFDQKVAIPNVDDYRKKLESELRKKGMTINQDCIWM